MEEPDLINRLRALSAGVPTRPSNMTRVRQHLQHIEDAIARGASHQEILAAFNEGQGENVMTLASFKSALQRARKEHKSGIQNARIGAAGRRPKDDASGASSSPASSVRPSMADFLPDPSRKE